MRQFIENQNPSEKQDTKDDRIPHAVAPNSIDFPPAVCVTFSAPKANEMGVNMFPYESTLTPAKLKMFLYRSKEQV